MTYILFLDDTRTVDPTLYGSTNIRRDDPRPIRHAKSPHEFFEYLDEAGCPSHIAFDHDLGGEEVCFVTGYDLVKEFCEMIMMGDLDLPENFTFSIHSANPVGAENIRSYLSQFIRKWRVAMRPDNAARSSLEPDAS